MIKQYLIVDDNVDDARQLVSMLDALGLYQCLGIVPTLEEAIEQIGSQILDMIFLDIRLEHSSGLTLLKTNTQLPPVVMVSAYPEYAVDSYEIGRAVDFLLKPFTLERLHMAISRALQRTRHPQHLIETDVAYLKMGRKVQRFEYSSIFYVEAFGIYSKVFTGDSIYTVNERISTLENLLPPRLFMRVHKSYLINTSKITSFDRSTIWLGRIQVPIGVSFRPRLEKLLGLFEGHDE